MYRIEYSGRARNDIQKLDPAVQLLILEAIEGKLLRAPEAFGKPLRHSLRLLRALRIGEWRILYQLSGTAVYIVTIRHRKKGYED
jgi:mRNA interferase RelE/StbE